MSKESAKTFVGWSEIYEAIQLHHAERKKSVTLDRIRKDIRKLIRHLGEEKVIEMMERKYPKIIFYSYG